MDFEGHFAPFEKRAICGPAVNDRADVYEEELRDLTAQRTGKVGTPLARLLRFYVKAWLADNLLVKADRMNMAHGVETRMPFLDHELVELAFALPDHLKLRGRTGKYILRQIAHSRLPQDITDRGKHGFTVPLERWLSSADEGCCDATLAMLADEGLIDIGGWMDLRQSSGTDLFSRRQKRTMWFFERWAEHGLAAL